MSVPHKVVAPQCKLEQYPMACEAQPHNLEIFLHQRPIRRSHRMEKNSIYTPCVAEMLSAMRCMTRNSNEPMQDHLHRARRFIVRPRSPRPCQMEQDPVDMPLNHLGCLWLARHLPHRTHLAPSVFETPKGRPKLVPPTPPQMTLPSFQYLPQTVAPLTILQSDLPLLIPLEAMDMAGHLGMFHLIPLTRTI